MLTMPVLHTRARNVHGSLRLLPGGQQLLRTSHLWIHRPVSGLAMGVLLAEYVCRLRHDLSILLHGGDQLRPAEYRGRHCR